MNGKELIKRILHHTGAPRVGFCFADGGPSDIECMSGVSLCSPHDPRLDAWGRHGELLARVGDFSGEVRLLPDGNIYGRLAGKTKGECIKGALQDGWELLDGYRLPTLDPDYLEKMKAKGRRFPDRYQLS